MSKMQRRHFNAVAEAVREIVPLSTLRLQLAERLADKVGVFNPRFDRRLFLETCGLAVETDEDA